MRHNLILNEQEVKFKYAHNYDQDHIKNDAQNIVWTCTWEILKKKFNGKGRNDFNRQKKGRRPTAR